MARSGSHNAVKEGRGKGINLFVIPEVFNRESIRVFPGFRPKACRNDRLLQEAQRESIFRRK